MGWVSLLDGSARWIARDLEKGVVPTAIALLLTYGETAHLA